MAANPIVNTVVFFWYHLQATIYRTFLFEVFKQFLYHKERTWIQVKTMLSFLASRNKLPKNIKMNLTCGIFRNIVKLPINLSIIYSINHTAKASRTNREILSRKCTIHFLSLLVESLFL